MSAMYEIGVKSAAIVAPWVPMVTATVFTGPLKNLILAKKKNNFWNAIKQIISTVIMKTAMGLTYGPFTPAVRFGVLTMKVLFPKIRMAEEDDVNGNPQLVEDDDESDPPSDKDATKNDPPPARTYGIGRLRRGGGGGGGGGGGTPPASYAQVNLLFPDLAQIATAVLVIAGLYLAYRAYVVARNLAKFTKMLMKIEQFANAEAAAGGLDGLRQTIIFHMMEAENSGSRSNLEAAYHRIAQIYKKTDETSKAVWKIEKEVKKSGDGGGGGWNS